MDRPDHEQDNWNMHIAFTTPAGRLIPTYHLYGETSQNLPPDMMHCESIAERSRLYNWEIRPHRHEAFFQILYIEEGSGAALLEDAREEISAPCIIVVPAMSVHGFQFSHDVRGLVVTMIDTHLDHNFAGDSGMVERLSVARQFALARGSFDAALVSQLFDSVAREFSGNAQWRRTAIGAGLAVAIVTAMRGLADDCCHMPETASRKLQHIQKFRDVVDKDYRSHRRIDHYASKLGITATQLNRICRDVLGKSALGVVNGRIMLEAERDLVYTVLEVKTIALSLGFSDAAYFSRFFAKQAGRTPTEFRRAANAQLGEQSVSSVHG